MRGLAGTTRSEQAARIRAAIGYSGREVREIADLMAAQLGHSFSYPTLRRRYDANDPGGFKTLDELHALAGACGVPATFLLEGFVRYTEDGPASERLSALERGLTATQVQLEAVMEEMAANRAGVREALEHLEVQHVEAALRALSQGAQPARPGDPPASERETGG